MTVKTTVPRERLAQPTWDRLKDILDEVLAQQSSAARAATVKRRCGSDAVLLREVESLLAEADSLGREPIDWLEDCADQATRTFWEEELSREGERIGAYLVVRQLGRGGMGAVYLGERADGQFEKRVAIKVLKRGTDTDDVLQRFAIERRIVARLDHPNIARLLDAGTTGDGLPYFVMEYVDGIPVTDFVSRRNLPVAARLNLFVKICRAVEVAHRAAVIHRDLKPRNILVTEEGEPKLLDFGIAKVLEPMGGAFDVTVTGRQHLTPSSASPEQVRGEAVTRASDVYALGALLFEMLSGRTASRFTTARPTRDDVARVICEEETPAPSSVATDPDTQRALRGDLDAIVQRAMRKDPAQRYQSAAELASDIEAHLSNGVITHAPRSRISASRRSRSLAVAAVVLLLAAGITAALVTRSNTTRSAPAVATSTDEVSPKSVAVLPFENLSDAAENAFFATGVQDAILTDLAKVADLKVLSRASVEQYSNAKTRDLREISRALNVAHVIEGGVQRAANRVRVTARLVDARTGEQKWAQNYDRELADVFSIQSQIAQTIVAQLQAKLLPREKAAIEVPPTRDPVAYDLYVRAREMVDSYLNAPDAIASLEQAIGLLTEATERDPQFAIAWCYTARAHSTIFAIGLETAVIHARQAEAALERAFALYPDLPEAHFAKAENFYRNGGRYEQAEREIALALPGMPNSAPLHTLAGNVWRRQGRWHEAEQILIKAVELDPKNVNAISFLSDTQVLMRRYTEAIATYERARAMGFDPVVFAVRVGIIEFLATGRSEPLRAAIARGPADFDIDSGDTSWRILFALMDRDYDRAAAALARSPRSTFQDVDLSFHYPRSWYEGVIARAAGRSDEALAAFRRALADLGGDKEYRRVGFRRLAVIAQALAAVGETERAIECAERAAQLVGRRWNAYDAPLVEQGLAQVYTWTGQHDRALEIVERLVKSPGYLSYGHLLHDPAWEPLRGFPRFQAIVASLAPR